MPRLRTNGGLIGPLNQAGNTVASGVWSVENQRLGKLKYWPEDNTLNLSKESNFRNTTLLIHADGSNNGNNSVFVDSSTTNATVVRGAGSPTQGSFSPHSHTGWSIYVNGRPQVTNTINLPGDFTIELWYYGIQWVTQYFILDTRINNNTNQNLVWTVTDVSGPNSTAFLTYPTIVNTLLNSWNHLALTRSGSTVYAYLNGVLLGSGTYSGNMAIGYLNFFSRWDTVYAATGYMSNFRIIDNACLYPNGTTFTPPTSDLTVTTDVRTAILLNKNTFRDATGNYTVTPSSTTLILPFSPFNKNTSYSSSDVGGSIYFNGTSDYITANSSPGFDISSSNNWTIEAWVYPTANQYGFIYQNYTTSSTPIFGQQFGISDVGTYRFGTYNGSGLGAPQFYLDSTGPGGTQFQLNTWTHLAAVRNGSGSNNITFYINGVAANTGTYTTWPAPGSSLTYIGARNYQGLADYFPGYISGLRVTKNVSIYTSNFVPPITPLTASNSNVTFLLSGTNASIVDSTAKNSIITVANTITSTAQAKYGSTSMFFDGTGDWLSILHNPYQIVRTYDFTVECWVYPTGGSGNNRGIISKGGASTGWSIIAASTNTWGFIHTATTVTGDIPVNLNRWAHVALVKSGTTLRLWVDGSLAAQASGISTDFTDTTPLYVGCGRTTDIPFTGYIDEVRMTLGVARYTSAFIPSLTAFPNI